MQVDDPGTSSPLQQPIDILGQDAAPFRPGALPFGNRQVGGVGLRPRFRRAPRIAKIMRRLEILPAGLDVADPPDGYPPPTAPDRRGTWGGRSQSRAPRRRR
jgi:hypothetical protein